MKIKEISFFPTFPFSPHPKKACVDSPGRDYPGERGGFNGMHLFCFQVDGPITGRGLTVMIQFSARGAYLLLAPQRRALIRDRTLI